MPKKTKSTPPVAKVATHKASRPPVVAILGHVDHGKTSLLDYIRKSRITNKEAGGITQKIGGYEIDTGVKGYSQSKITFIDTPGHEAFSEMRSRGAQVADIALLIVDSKDGPMPQTAESAAHIREANVPCIVVLTKSDLPDANPEKVKRDLLKVQVQVEGLGGDVPVVSVSSKTGDGVPELLETILLVTEDKGLTGDAKSDLECYVIESKKDKRGVIPSVIIKAGTLTVGQTVYAGETPIKIRSLISDTGKPLHEIIPSQPAEVLGFTDLPPVGTRLTQNLVKSTALAAEPEEERAFSLQDVLGDVEPEKKKKLPVILKADAQGSLDAIVASIGKIPGVEIVLSAVGGIHRSDVFLAKTTKAIVIGFSVYPDPEVEQVAKQDKVIIKTYAIIYELLEELEQVSDLLAEKEEKEKSVKGEAKVVALFKIEGEVFYGCKITKGKMNAGDTVEIYRDDKTFGKSRIISLKFRAKNIAEVKKDMECGMGFSPPLDIRTGDVVKCVL